MEAQESSIPTPKAQHTKHGHASEDQNSAHLSAELPHQPRVVDVQLHVVLVATVEEDRPPRCPLRKKIWPSSLLSFKKKERIDSCTFL